MTCRRCQGLLMATTLLDDDGVVLPVWKCCLCGDVIDETILKHRARRVEPLSHASDYSAPLRLSR
jgi:hypothetical protein